MTEHRPQLRLTFILSALAHRRRPSRRSRPGPGTVASTAVSALANGTARPLATVTLACASAATVLVVPLALAPPVGVHD